MRESTKSLPFPVPLSGVKEAYIRHEPGARAIRSAVQVPPAAMEGWMCWKPVRSERMA
ncbi:hypothetical protein OG625_09875 [Streptomyces sp. NBC_01351]|uniref:hypothetical protein n=1 Tax=Streptomyces sp. NBC_01351 TaxID=2903833 RepID=UPI002E31B74C|nr:hypothetical protein [Streptomyces sp. NBC_01351]